MRAPAGRPATNRAVVLAVSEGSTCGFPWGWELHMQSRGCAEHPASSNRTSLISVTGPAMAGVLLRRAGAAARLCPSLARSTVRSWLTFLQLPAAPHILPACLWGCKRALQCQPTLGMAVRSRVTSYPLCGADVQRAEAFMRFRLGIDVPIPTLHKKPINYVCVKWIGPSIGLLS